MTRATVSRWARRYVLASAASLVAWQAGGVVGLPWRAGVVLGVYGFVLHAFFGKAYTLVPAYFDRDLAFDRAPAVQLPFVAAGTVGLVGASLGVGPSWLGAAGAVLWAVGVCVFVGTLLWTVRDNPTGSETATGGTDAERRRVDRLANAAVPVALCYLLAGTYGTLAWATGLPPLVDGYVPRTTHLLTAGTAGVAILGLGFRLLPRFLAASPPRPLVAVVLPAGALGPALLAVHLGDAAWFQVGAAVEAVAILGFGLAVGLLFVRSDRRRVGFYAVLAGAAGGAVAVTLGLWFGAGGRSPALVAAHRRLNLLGFLGLTIVGMAYQFYPPAVGRAPGASDRTALVSIAGLAGGLAVGCVGLVAGHSWLVAAGRLSALCGALLYAFLLVAAFRAR
jgi:hypothetical protein